MPQKDIPEKQIPRYELPLKVYISWCCCPLPQVPAARATDPTGQLGRAMAEEGLWATYLAMQAAGVPPHVSRRALSKAIHISPSSVRSWARLGMVTVDSAVHPGGGAQTHDAPADEGTVMMLTSVAFNIYIYIYIPRSLLIDYH